MMNTTYALPSLAPGGLDALLGRHFGKADCFTLVQVQDGALVDVEVIPGIPHGSGGCLAPVRHLAASGVEVLIAGGIGARPLRGLLDAGIAVLAGPPGATVGGSVRAALNEELRPFPIASTCGGE